MVSKKLNQLFFMRMIISFALLFSCVAQAMDQAIIPKIEDVGWKFFFTHSRDALPYADEHSFAQTSRGNCALIYTIQDQRKNCVYNCIVKNNIELNDSAQFVYHRSWRVFGVVDIIDKKEDKTSSLSSSAALRMFSCELNGNQFPVCKVAVWDNFKAQLPHNPSPFFNKNKELCFHGFQEDVYVDPSFPSHSIIWKGFVEYTMSQQLACKLLIPERILGELCIGLAEFLKFPVLLKNILDSDEATIEIFGCIVPKSKIYHLDKVKLSDNYKYFRDLLGTEPEVTSFGNLLQSIRNALARRYKQQQETEQ